jgi:hypothetical protein
LIVIEPILRNDSLFARYLNRISAEIGWAMKAKMVVQVDGIQKAF